MNRLQKNMIIKPIKLDANNKLLTRPDSNRKKEDEHSKDDIDDDSSVSSIDSDAGGFTIWDNSELNLRGINSEDFQDFYGKKLSFLQLFKLRSSFYTKQIIPPQAEIFKGAEKIYRFCSKHLKLDDFLDEDRQCDVLEVNLQQDKNFERFSRYFDHSVELNSQKFRAEKYDRYNPNDNLNENSQTQRKNQDSTVIHALGLSPRKAPKQNTETSKNQMSMHQLDEMHRKKKNLMQPIKVITQQDDDDSTSPPKTQNLMKKGLVGQGEKVTNPASFLGKPSALSKPNNRIFSPQKQKHQLDNSKQITQEHQGSNSPFKRQGAQFTTSTTTTQSNFFNAAQNEMNGTMRSTQTRMGSMSNLSDIKLPKINQKDQSSNSPLKKDKIMPNANVKLGRVGSQFDILNPQNLDQTRKDQLDQQRGDQSSRNHKRYFSNYGRDQPKP